MRSPSSFRFHRWLLLVGVFVGALGVGWPAPVHAHNTLESSSPAEGAVLTEAPTQISMVFTNSVPLDSASVQVTDATGIRQDAVSLAHGPLGERELIAMLPATVAGEVSVRWRLVGADGHPISERITFTVAAVAVTTTVSAANSTPTTLVGNAGDTVAAPAALAGDEPFSTPSAVRWLARYLSYLALLVVVGVALTDVLVWRGAGGHPRLARLVSQSLAVVGALAMVQLVILAADIGGVAPWSALGSVDVAVGTTAGLALLVRVALVAVAWLLCRRMEVSSVDIRWAALAVVGVALLGTWAAAGHASSQRWPELGVVLDVAHHGAAGFWLGSLAIVGLVAIPVLPADALGGAVRQLSRWATVSVAMVAATGLVQAVRLGHGPSTLFSSRHGGLLGGKVALFAVMLALGAMNRRRLADESRAAELDRPTVQRLRRSILIEVALGLGVLALSASLVVAVPAIAR